MRLDTLLDGMSTNEIHWSAIWGTEVIKSEHKVCKGCASAKHRRVDGDDIQSCDTSSLRISQRWG